MNRHKRIKPEPGQESVWDYPRPPRLEDSNKRIEVFFNGVKIADTTRAKRVLETSHPPVYYIPPEDVQMHYFTPTSYSSFCEFKGRASYYTITVGEKSIPNGAWYYRAPTISRSIQAKWMPAILMGNACRRRRAIFMEGGLRKILWSPADELIAHHGAEWGPLWPPARAEKKWS